MIHFADFMAMCAFCVHAELPRRLGELLQLLELGAAKLVVLGRRVA